MPSPLNLDKIVADNPGVDLELLRKGEKTLETLQRTGTVRPSTYELDTPESKRNTHFRGGASQAGYERMARRLR
jgi:hypothetical protein